MQHTESSIKIYHTKEYARFRTITGNRELNSLKINRIIKDIENGLDVLRYCPVLVKEEGGVLRIIDGQHRFFVSKKVKSPVWYIISEDMNLQQIAKINSNTEKWKDRDFLNCYIQLGNKHYQKLQEFIDEYNFPIGISLILLQKGMALGDGGGTSGIKHRFRAGEFEVLEWDKAVELSNQVKLFSSFPGHNHGGFIEAIGRIIRSGKIQIRDLVKKYERDPLLLTPQKNAKQYLNNLEVVYNQNLRTRQTIY